MDSLLLSKISKEQENQIGEDFIQQWNRPGIYICNKFIYKIIFIYLNFWIFSYKNNYLCSSYSFCIEINVEFFVKKYKCRVLHTLLEKLFGKLNRSTALNSLSLLRKYACKLHDHLHCSVHLHSSWDSLVVHHLIPIQNCLLTECHWLQAKNRSSEKNPLKYLVKIKNI